jgi:hypothetical protein
MSMPGLGMGGSNGGFSPVSQGLGNLPGVLDDQISIWNKTAVCDEVQRKVDL